MAAARAALVPCLLLALLLVAVHLTEAYEPAPKRDHYAVLGVSSTATEGEIKRAYRRLARRWHPDKNPDDVEGATRKFAEIGSAYEVLSDARRRREYDHDRKYGFNRRQQQQRRHNPFGGQAPNFYRQQHFHNQGGYRQYYTYQPGHTTVISFGPRALLTIAGMGAALFLLWGCLPGNGNDEQDDSGDDSGDEGAAAGVVPPTRGKRGKPASSALLEANRRAPRALQLSANVLEASRGKFLVVWVLPETLDVTESLWTALRLFCDLIGRDRFMVAYVQPTAADAPLFHHACAEGVAQAVGAASAHDSAGRIFALRKRSAYASGFGVARFGDSGHMHHTSAELVSQVAAWCSRMLDGQVPFVACPGRPGAPLRVP